MEAPPNSNLIVNYLPPNYTEVNLYELFAPFGHILHYKIVKNLETSRSMGYGFVQFADPECANKAVAALNGLPLQNKQLKVSIARPASSEIKRSNLYIIGLPLNWTKQDLHNLFSSYGDVVESRILLDNNSRQSRGVGFCRLGSNAAALRAIDALNGTIPNGGSTKLTIKIADNPNHMRRQNHGGMSPQHQGHAGLHNQGQPGQMSPQSQGHAHGHLIGNPVYPQQQYKLDYRHYQQYQQPSFGYQSAPGSLVPQHFGSSQQHPHFPVVKPNNMGGINNNIGNGINNMNGLNTNMNNGMNNMNSMVMGNGIASSSPVMHSLHHNGVVNPAQVAAGGSNQFQGYCLFVYHLPLDVTDQALYELFSQYATVTSTKVMKDISTGRSRGYGFVNVLTEQDGQNAIQNLNSHKIGTKFIKVSFKSSNKNQQM